MIYDPHDDSFLLEHAVKQFAQHKSVCDMGAGSGILALAAKKAGAKSVLAVDISEDAVNHCKKQGLDVLHSDLFEKIPFEQLFDCIVFNPPYLPLNKDEDKESQRITTGGLHGHELTLRFLQDAMYHLEDDGTILIIVSDLAPLHRIESFLEKNNLDKEVVGTKKLFMETIECWKITSNK